MFKTCKICGETKEAVKGIWVTVRGKATGLTCLACRNVSSLAYLAKLKEQPDGREIINARYRNWTAKNRLEVNARSKAYNAERRTTEAGKQSAATATKNYRERNLGKVAQWRLTRRTSELQRTPMWLTSDDYRRIEDKYVVAQWFSYLAMMPYHVDHIISLNGTIVSGLHIPSNLCVKLGRDNISKGNKWVP